MRNGGLRFIFLVALIIILTSASTGYETPFLKGTNNGIEDTGCIELAEVYYEDTTSQAEDVFVSGDYAYVACQYSGLAVIDISDPTNPDTPIYEPTANSARGVFVSGSYAYVATGTTGLAVIDISDPTNPGTPVYEATTGYAQCVFVSGDYAYVADGNSGLAVIDISDPTNPGTPVYEATTDSAINVFVSGDYAYVAVGYSGLAVIDISDPTNPDTPIYMDTSYAFDVFVDDNYAYVAAGSGGLAAIDVSDPTNPSTPIYESTTGSARGVFVSGNYAYVADYASGLAMVNISDPTNPGTPIYEVTSGNAWSVFVSGNYAYVANGDSGLAVIQTSTTTATPTTTTTDTTVTSTTSTTGTGPDSTSAILATGGGVAAIAIIGVLLVLRKQRLEELTPALPPSQSPDIPEAPIVEEAAEVLFVPVVKEEALDEIIEEPLIIDEVGVQALRGCAVIGGRFDYKVKIINNTDSVITNTTVTILSYPDDCLVLSTEKTKTLKRIGPGEFRSPQFTFVPTKDCVEGRVIATVSYIDHLDQPHTVQVEPYLIRSVCDLLEPLESTMQQFELIIGDMEQTIENRALPWNPNVLFSKVLTFLPSRNFHIIDSSDDTIGNIFTGRIRGLAEGKYTRKKVAIRILISGDIGSNESKIVIEGLGEDMAMLPTTLEELRTGIDSWTCMNCGAALVPDEVGKIKTGVPIPCKYCGRTMTIELYRK